MNSIDKKIEKNFCDIAKNLGENNLTMAEMVKAIDNIEIKYAVKQFELAGQNLYEAYWYAVIGENKVFKTGSLGVYETREDAEKIIRREIL